MSTLSSSGQQIAQDLSQRHGFSVDAVTHMLIAVLNGNGSMAQFSHPEFGGSGQWMRGGMMMLGDMFNTNLKYRVSSLCEDCATAISQNQTGMFTGSFQSQSQSGGSDHQTQTAGGGFSQNSLFVPDPNQNWWPTELGQPSASGSQNHVKYAYFANARRLAVATGSDIWVYDTQQHNIGGFSQQQSGDGSITFTSQFGTVSLSTLPVVSRNGVANTAPVENIAPTPAPQPVAAPEPLPTSQPASSNGQATSNSSDIFDQINRLGELRDKSYITQEEFDQKRAELLSRI
ncbi:SHOCT domain-containing protein [Rubripirellula amarantea]|uniref:SHOCT domain-containing protein n=1 Tax=Rubripirellula amarantea TaxID=2527999 RepID=A0A5C5WWM0_9BACT|nr:SHOCT domain-containing protein [Rubripirellula amarantea]MDA8743738.1 SHOCT domain-containing protein [Rubripirellula amarantea]TWT54609.1 hypothetical protein Pla22_22590 [Rubripirellula amarantea]